MMKQVLRCAVIGLAMALGACFESAQPLIAPGNADFPFNTGVRYTFYEWDKDKGIWQPSETGTVNREGDHYVQLDDGGLVKDAKPFLLKSIGNGYFVAQQPNEMVYVYDLLRIQGDIVYQYGMPCTDADKTFADDGLLDSFTKDTQYGNTCTVSDFDKLTQVLRTIAKDRPQPQGMYALTR
jgi:hypothetical protein